MGIIIKDFQYARYKQIVVSTFNGNKFRAACDLNVDTAYSGSLRLVLQCAADPMEGRHVDNAITALESGLGDRIALFPAPLHSLVFLRVSLLV
ncbi:unnamed protein product, partial [Iphiclides podalirius]